MRQAIRAAVALAVPDNRRKEMENGRQEQPSVLRCVPGMARIQLEINQPQVVTAKCSEPQVSGSIKIVQSKDAMQT